MGSLTERAIKAMGLDHPIKVYKVGNSPVVQWLGLRVLTAEGLGSIPGQGTKIPQAVWHGQKKKKVHKVHKMKGGRPQIRILGNTSV